MIMTCETMKVKRYTDKVLVNCCRNDRDLVIRPTTLGFTPHSIRAEKKGVFWIENQQQHGYILTRNHYLSKGGGGRSQ